MNEQNRFREAINEIPVPSKELDAILVDAFKKEKKQVRFSFKRMAKYIAAAGLISICTISSAYVSPAFANFVTQIPIIGQAFDYFILQEDYYKAYEEISTDIGLVEKSNGIEIIIQKAFYDGNTVTLSYVLRTEEDLGSFPTFKNLPTNVQNASYGGDYVEGVGYVGMMMLSMRGSKQDKVNIDWNPQEIYSEDEIIEGDWHFEFSLNKLEGKYIAINERVSHQDGVSVELIDAVKTDVNLTINYLQDVEPSIHDRWGFVEAELSAIDNLGNKYEVPYNGGTGEGGDSSEDITWNATIHGLDPEATSITFYPFAHVSNSQSDSKKINFESITIELN